MEDIAFFWRAQPDIARDFLRILVLLFVGSMVRSIFPLVLICRRGVPPSLVSAIKGKIEAPGIVQASLESAEEAFTNLNESIMADIRLMRLICTLMVVLSLIMVGCVVSRVYHNCLIAPRLDDVQCTLLATVQLLELLGVGLTLCTTLHAATNALEYVLQRRKVKWHRFLVDAKRALSVAKT